MINKEYRDEKAVKNAITKIHNGEYKIVRAESVETEVETEDYAAETTVAEEEISE